MNTYFPLPKSKFKAKGFQWYPLPTPNSSFFTAFISFRYISYFRFTDAKNNVHDKYNQSYYLQMLLTEFSLFSFFPVFFFFFFFFFFFRGSLSLISFWLISSFLSAEIKRFQNKHSKIHNYWLVQDIPFLLPFRYFFPFSSTFWSTNKNLKFILQSYVDFRTYIYFLFPFLSFNFFLFFFFFAFDFIYFRFISTFD